MPDIAKTAIESTTDVGLAGLLPRIDRREPVRQQVHDALREAIIWNVLRPGQALSENDIADALAVSRTPSATRCAASARKASSTSSAERDALVTKLDTIAIADSLFARSALECALVRKVAASIRPAGIRELRAICAGRSAPRQRRMADVVRTDEELHRRLTELSGHGGLWRLVASLRGPWERARNLAIREFHSGTTAIEAHAAIIDALAAGDADAAERAMRAHIAHNATFTAQLRLRHPDYFVPEDGPPARHP
ncbi:MAG: GntR family transcriptional regulator [Geminicoccaceae bacterium]